MAQTVKINGVTYNDVDKVQMPLASDTSRMVVYLNTEDATAVAASIKNGETAYVGGKKVTGTMPVNGAVGGTLDASNPSATIPTGYTPGGEVMIQPETKNITPTKSAQDVTPTAGKVLTKVSIGAIPSEYITTTDATAEAADIAKGETAYVNGKKVTGTHTDPAFTLANGVLSIV
jgi:hypothetical protein